MKVNVAIVDAFVDGQSGGNPAGVVLNADALSAEQKLQIARKVGLSETAFVSDSQTADFKLDFFTPNRQIAHCGHATIATFSHLSQQGLVPTQHTSKETVDGDRAIEVQGDFAYMAQLKPSYIDVSHKLEQILLSLGLEQQHIVGSPRIVNTGNGFLVVGVSDIETLESIQPNQSIIEQLSEEYDLIGYYVFTSETNVAGRDASTRMFAPRYGIDEESATGMAAGPLACYLHDIMHIQKDSFQIEQGYAMQPASPSCINVVLNFEQGDIVGLKAGGVGKPSRFEEIEI